MRTARVLLLDEQTGEVISPVDVLSIAKLITCNDGETVQQKIDSGQFQGKPGSDGKDGKTPNISIGTVTVVDTIAETNVTKTGTPDDVILNFFIPKGEKGDTIISSSEIDSNLNFDYEQHSVGLYKSIPALQLDYQINYTFDKDVILNSIVYSQSAWKSIDCWSLYIDDKLLFDRIYTKESGECKVLSPFYPIKAWQTVKVIHHNESGNSKEIWVDINYLMR